MNNWASPTRIAIGSICLIASFVMSVVTWVGLGDIAGYGAMRFVLPAVVDTYIMVALLTWLTVPDSQVASLSRGHTFATAVFSTLVQSIYHCAITWVSTHSQWMASLAFVVGGTPPAGAFAAAHMIIRAARVTVTAGPDSQATVPAPSPPAATPVLSPPQPPEPTPTAARPASPEQPAIAPLPPPQPTVAPKPVSAPTTSPTKRSPRISAAPTAPGRAFPSPLKEWEIQAIYNGLDKKLPYWQIAESVGRSTSVVNKYAAERRKQLAQARNGNGAVRR